MQTLTKERREVSLPLNKSKLSTKSLSPENKNLQPKKMLELTNQPPAPTPFGPVLPPQHVIKIKKRKNLLTWYLLTLIMRQKLETREELVISMKEIIEKAFRDDLKATSGKPCIFRVPKYLQENNEESYFPQTVSIGPYHHGKEHLLPMEHHKRRAVDTVLKRTKHPIEMYIDAMKELEERARACYEGPISLSSNEFVQMLVLDGCFVLELIGGVKVNYGLIDLEYHSDDPILAIRASMHSIRSDMIMLENQLPLFVLKKLLELQRGTANRTGLVARLTGGFFLPLMPSVNYWGENFTGTRIPEPIEPPADFGEFHCLDVLRRSLLLHASVPVSGRFRRVYVADKRVHQWIPCVTELRDAGFKVRKRMTKRFRDIRFNNCYVEIPKIRIHDGTKALFLNLIAFEECYTDWENDITSYLIVMDNLINTPEDVSYLRECGIIQHSLGSDSEVANMFNTLCQGVVFDLNGQVLLNRLRWQVLQHKKKSYILKWNTWKRSLKQKYFENPWAYFSFSGALLLIGLTFSQTYFAGYAYYKPTP